MKIRNLFLAVMTLVLTVTGCSKVDTPAADNDLKFVFEMADKDGFGADTKAVKTAWADEDMVYILFKPTGAEECLLYSKDGDKKHPKYATTTYSYDQDAWDLVPQNLEEGDLGTGGKYYAIHHRGYIDMDDKTGMGKDCFPLNTYSGGELLSYVGDYTVEGNTVNLGVIRMKMDERIFQVSIGMQLWLNTTPETSFWLNDFYENDRVTSIDGYHDEWIEESVVMSIYNNSVYNPGWASLQPGAVSVDLKDEKIFVYNDDEKYKENATAVLNYDDDADMNEVSFYFADYKGITTPEDYYAFIVKRYDDNEHGQYYYPEDLRSFYLFVEHHYKNRNIHSGNAYRLPAVGWSL